MLELPARVDKLSALAIACPDAMWTWSNLHDRLWEWREKPWKQVSVLGLAGVVILAAVLVIPEAPGPLGRGPMIPHMIALIPHEGGHMVLGGLMRFLPFTGNEETGIAPFAEFCVIAAGTLGQLLAVFIPIGIFLWRKSPTPLAFFLFFLLATFPGIGIYMMDCRVLTLDYVAPGGVDYEQIQQEGQDWTKIFRYLRIPFGAGEKMGSAVYHLGWFGMPVPLLWLGWVYKRRGYRPGQPEPEAVAVAAAGSQAALRGSELLLLVHGDNSYRESLAVLLRHKGYAVHQAASSMGAVEELYAHSRRPQMLIAACSLGDVRGTDLLQKLRLIEPAIKAILLLGEAEATPLSSALLPGVAFVRRPFTENFLALKIREVLDSPASTMFAAN
jgi:CheY-like chemotaxis protein